MLGKTLTFAACVFIFVSLVIPARDEAKDGLGTFSNTSSSASRSAQQSGQSGSGQADSGWYAGDHTLQRQGDGHFYANANVQGASVRMMVDTGASVIALTAADASAAGLYWDDTEVRHIGQGANGAVYGVPARLDEVEIGGMVRRNVDAVIIPQGLGISLLGQSYLSQIGDVNISGDQMVMSGN